MIDLVAKRYVKALLEGRDSSSITAIYKELNEISTAYTDEKFLAIITSSEVRATQKAALVISFVNDCSAATQNFVKVLASNKRLDIIPHIVKELDAQVAIISNSYAGIVYTNKELSAQYVTSIEEKFSKKFDVNLTLTQDVCDYDGIKVDIDGLGVEISFSKARLKSQLIDHILKAV